MAERSFSTYLITLVEFNYQISFDQRLRQYRLFLVAAQQH